MNDSFRKFSSYLLLAIYVPVALLVNLGREHHPLYIHVSSGKHPVIIKYNPHNLRSPDDNLCQACQFVQGHISPIHFSLTVHFKSYRFLFPEKKHSVVCEKTHLPLKRAPPVNLTILS